MISSTIKEKQNELLTAVKKKIKIFAQITWQNNTKLNIYTTEERILSDIDRLKLNHTNYHKIPYHVIDVKILTRVNKNPHIKFAEDSYIKEAPVNPP